MEALFLDFNDKEIKFNISNSKLHSQTGRHFSKIAVIFYHILDTSFVSFRHLFQRAEVILFA